MISLCSKYEINTSTGELARLVLILPCLLLQGGEKYEQGCILWFYQHLRLYWCLNNTDESKDNWKSNLIRISKSSMSLFPDGLKTEKYKNGRGKSSGGDRGRPKGRGHRRTDSHDHSYTSPFSGRREKKKLQTANQSYLLPKIHFSTTYQKMGVLALMVAEIWAISFWRFAYQFCKIKQNVSFESEILESNCLSDVLTFKN